MEREGVPDLGVFVERATDRTPDSRRFHVYHGEQLIGSFASRKKAREIYRKTLEAAGYTPPKPEAKSTDSLSPIERERLSMGFDASETYWGSTKAYRKRGRYR